MPVLAVPVFALCWWLAAYLVGRDHTRPVLWRAAAVLVTYAVAVAVWTVVPAGPAARVLVCLPALLIPYVITGLLPDTVPERQAVDRGALVLAVLFLVLVLGVPGAVRLVALAPPVAGLVVLWHFGDTVRPYRLPVPVTTAAALYGLGLVVLLLPVDLGPPGPVLAAMGLDLLLLGYLVAVADAVDSGERLHADLTRSAVAAVAALAVVGGPAALTVLAAPGVRAVAVLQFVLVAAVLTGVGLAGPVRRGLDRVAFPHDDRLRLRRARLSVLADALPRRRDRARLVGLSEPEFRRLVQRAFEHYGDLGRLLRSPLTDLPAVDRRVAGRDTGPPARAVELRAVLRESVARFKPAGVFGTTPEWRVYNALHYGWVVGLRPYDRQFRGDGLDRDALRALEWFRGQVSPRSMRGWQAEGVRLVADRLWDEVLRAGQPARTPPTHRDDATHR